MYPDVPHDPETPVVAAPLTPATRPRRLGGVAAIICGAIVVILAGSGLFVAGFVFGSQTASQPGTPVGQARAFHPFWDAYQSITQHYAGEPVPQKQVIDGAIKGMLESLGDPFSFYMTPDEYRASLEGLSGQFEGIGATITSRKADGTESCTPLGPDCFLVVVKPVAGAPAEKAGVKAGDRITRVNGVSVDGATVDDTLKKVRGPKGTVVTLTMVRGTAAPIDIAITRAVVIQAEVEASDLAGGRVGYIKLAGFSDNATRDFIAALRADVTGGRKQIVFDLRGNGGGYVLGARQIASQFIASGPIFWEKAATGDPIPTEAGSDGLATDASIRVVVLVDSGTASASEIVAGALQDTKRATLVGRQTYGKGTVQEFLPLEDDNGGYRLTIARWLTPDQRWINKTGLTPDVLVPEPAAGSVPAGADPVLDRALQILGQSGATSPQLEPARAA